MKQIFINIPVDDLEKSTQFYLALGFTENSLFTGENQKCVIWSDSNRKVLTEYLFNIRNKRNKSISRTKEHLIDCYAYCSKHLKGNIKDYGLGSLLRDYILYDPTHSINDVFYSFQKTKSGSINYITKLYNERILTNGISPSNILSLKVENTNQQLVELKSVFTRNLILIDCWATWCIPCRNQIPYLDSLNKLMADKLQIISLSADENISKWYTWLSKTNHTNNSIAQVHAPDGFKNIFFKRLNISSIPRYILINNSGVLLNTEMPFPDQKEKIIKIINSFTK
jgi:thiol-disulfide isomerase/thioredoxin